MNTMENLNIVKNVLATTYGRGEHTALANDVLGTLANLRKDDSAEQEVTNTIWMWYPGGSTANRAAKDILIALGMEG